MLGQLGNKLPLVGNQQPQRRGLTHDFAWANAKDGVIIVTWGNAHYHDFVSSWIASLRAVGVTNMVVGALDGTLYDRLERVGIPTFFIASGLTRSDFGWGSRSFHLMGRQKVTLLRDFTNMGLSVLLTDVDTTWMRNPLPYFASFTNADLLVSSDTLTTTSFDGSLEVPRKARGAFNIGTFLHPFPLNPLCSTLSRLMAFLDRAGIIYAKPSARPMVDDWLRELQENLRLWDQAIFNRILRRGTESGSALPDNTVRSSGQTWSVRFGILPVGYFCSGHTFFVQHMPNTLKASAYVAHATFQFSGTPGKRHRFREAQLWNDETSYYANPGKLLTISEPIPEWIWANSNDSIAGHFRLVNFQLRQIRSAMGLAIALNRTLVLPQLWCGFDRWWAPHRGRIPGSAFSLPFRCPLDHVFSVNILTSNLNPIHYGPNVRQSLVCSFLSFVPCLCWQ